MKLKDHVIPTSPGNKKFFIGDLVSSNFSTDYMLVYCDFPIEKLIPSDSRFYKNDVAVILGVVVIPDSVYTNGYAKIFFSGATGWVPYRWLRLLKDSNE